jgi:hypothetical protein
MNQVMTDVDLAALYNSVLMGIGEIDRQAKEPDGAQARIMSSRLADFLNKRTSPPGAERKNNPVVGFPPEMTTEAISGEIGLRILINMAHRGSEPGDCEAADKVARHIMATLDRAMDKGAESQQSMVAIFRVAQTAASALLALYPDFEVFLRAHGVPSVTKGLTSAYVLFQPPSDFDLRLPLQSINDRASGRVVSLALQIKVEGCWGAGNVVFTTEDPMRFCPIDRTRHARLPLLVTQMFVERILWSDHSSAGAGPCLPIVDTSACIRDLGLRIPLFRYPA